MILLRYHGRYADIAEFDPSTKHIAWRKRAPGEPRLPISGWIGKVGSEDVLLYKNGAHLQLLVEGRELDARHVSSELDDLGPVRHLQLCASGETVLDVTYPAPIIDPPINDVLSPGETEENYDYALFLKNVLNDPRGWRSAWKRGPDHCAPQNANPTRRRIH